jgi:hypothetical protein
VLPLPVVPLPVVPVEVPVPVVEVPDPVVPPVVVPVPVVPDPLFVGALAPAPVDAWVLLGAVTTPPQPLAMASAAARAGNKTVNLIDDFIRSPSTSWAQSQGLPGEGAAGESSQ